jgi:tRNA threonylcarbamoyl adenosine modification protein YeaZ
MIEADSRALPQGLWLVIEASTSAGSVALLRHGASPAEVVASCDVPMGSARDDVLTPAVHSLITDAGFSLRDVNAVVCGAGPGSFTSLRIAGALIKGLAYGLQVPLFALPSMLLAARGVDDAPAAGRYGVAMDALRGEYYVQTFTVSEAGTVAPISGVSRITAEQLAHDGSYRVISATGDIKPHASVARWINDWTSFGPESLDTWEPAYGRLAEAQVKWEATHGRALTLD